MSERFLFTPGPVRISPDILALGAQQPPYFRNQAFSEVVLECESGLLELAGAPAGSRVVFLAGSGTAAMEACVINLLSERNRALVVNGGGFGQRFVDICVAHRQPHHSLPVRLDNLAEMSSRVQTESCDTLLINAHETTTGLLYDLDAVRDFVGRHNMLNIVDGISMFISDPVEMCAQSIDALIVSSHKGLALPPGLSMVLLGRSALERIVRPASLYLDFHSYLKDGTRGQTPFTPPITIMLQLQLRLRQLLGGGIAAEQQRLADVATHFRNSISPLPLACFSPSMPNAMTALTPTNELSAERIVRDLEARYDMVVTPNGGDLRHRVFRVAHMGHVTIEYTDHLIEALFDYYGKRSARSSLP